MLIVIANGLCSPLTSALEVFWLRIGGYVQNLGSQSLTPPPKTNKQTKQNKKTLHKIILKQDTFCLFSYVCLSVVFTSV